MEVKSESEVAQSCLTPSDPMDCSLPGSSVHGISQAKVLERVPLLSPIAQLRESYLRKYEVSSCPAAVQGSSGPYVAGKS